jgi:hypothetical protein
MLVFDRYHFLSVLQEHVQAQQRKDEQLTEIEARHKTANENLKSTKAESHDRLRLLEEVQAQLEEALKHASAIENEELVRSASTGSSTEAMQQLLNDHKATVERLQLQVDDGKARVEQCNATIKRLETENTQLNKIVDKHNKMIKEQGDNVLFLTGRVSAQEVLLKEKEQQHTARVRELTIESDKQCADLRRQLSDLQSKVKVQETQQQSARVRQQDLNDFQIQILAARDENARLIKKNIELEKAIRAQQSSLGGAPPTDDSPKAAFFQKQNEALLAANEDQRKKIGAQEALNKQLRLEYVRIVVST